MKRHALLGYDIVQAADMRARGALGAPPPRALRRRRLSRRPRRRGDPARVAHHPRRRRLRRDDLRPALPPGARAGVRARRAAAATPARSSTRPSSRRSGACSPAPATRGSTPARRPPRPEAQRPRRAGAVAAVGGRDHARGRAYRAQLLELLAQRGLPLVVEVRLAGASGSRSRKTRSETLRSVIGMASIPRTFFGTLTSDRSSQNPRRTWSEVEGHLRDRRGGAARRASTAARVPAGILR